MSLFFILHGWIPSGETSYIINLKQQGGFFLCANAYQLLDCFDSSEECEVTAQFRVIQYYDRLAISFTDVRKESHDKCAEYS